MNRTICCISLILAATSAQAQNPQPASPENPTVPLAPQNAPAPPPERIAPSGGGGNLSDQLARQRGTVTPPSVDPGMSVSPPNATTGRMPVIAPPGSPGGRSNVVPK